MVRLKAIPRLACWLAFAIVSGPCTGLAEPPSAAPSAVSDSGTAPGFSTTRTGAVHDFDYLVGAWTTHQRRLKTRGVGASDWEDAPPNRHCARSYMDGAALVEESRFPDGRPAGLFLYAFSPQKRQWSIYWVNSKTGQPDAGVSGGFDGTRGEFYQPDDEDNGRHIEVRVIWTKLDRDHVRWEQAFSYDNHSWETNWISDFTRADPAICSGS